MSVFDWIQAGLTAHPEVDSPAAGSVAITLGTAIQGYYGSRLIDFIGGDSKLVFDPLSYIATRALPSLQMLVSGIGGNVAFVYGPATNLIYGGPSAVIRRGPEWKKTSDSFLGSTGGTSDWLGTFPGVGQPGSPPSPGSGAEKVVCAAVSALSLLLVGVTVAIELCIKIKYWKMGSAIPPPMADLSPAMADLSATPMTDLIPSAPMVPIESQDQQNPPPAAPSAEETQQQILLTTLAVAKPRLMAAISMLEQGLTLGQFGKNIISGAIGLPALPFVAIGLASCKAGEAITSRFLAGYPGVVAWFTASSTNCVDAMAFCTGRV